MKTAEPARQGRNQRQGARGPPAEPSSSDGAVGDHEADNASGSTGRQTLATTVGLDATATFTRPARSPAATTEGETTAGRSPSVIRSNPARIPPAADNNTASRAATPFVSEHVKRRRSHGMGRAC